MSVLDSNMEREGRLVERLVNKKQLVGWGRVRKARGDGLKESVHRVPGHCRTCDADNLVASRFGSGAVLEVGIMCACVLKLLDLPAGSIQPASQDALLEGLYNKIGSPAIS